MTETFSEQTCYYCDTPNQFGKLFCDACGNSLFEKERTKPTRPPSFTDLLNRDESNESSLLFDKPLIINIIDDNTNLVIRAKSETTVGRSSLLGSNKQKIDIDLVPFSGFTQGVSQLHAVIQREDDSIYLIDKCSKNGTTLNGIPLKPNEPSQVKNGDIAHLGSLAIRFKFS